MVQLSSVHAQVNSPAAVDATRASWPDPMAPIVVGPREAVGKESLGSKAVKSVFSGLTRHSGGKSGRTGPKTRRDPSRKIDYVMSENQELDLEVGARTKWDGDGLLVSSRIEESGDKGTFQSVFLQDCSGRRLYPAAISIYKIWSEHSISVSWTKTTTVDGKVVSQESGGWSDSWSEDWSEDWGGVAAEAPASGPPGIWQQAGYDRAHDGVRQVGAYFNVDRADLANCDLELFVHVSRPEQDPVVTEGTAFLLDEQGGAGPAVTATDRRTLATAATQAERPPCEEALLSIEQKKAAFLARLDDPRRLLAAALQAASGLGEATHAAGIANAGLAAEQALLDNLQNHIEAWDRWFTERLEQKERRRQERYGRREPSWATGSRARAEQRHHERTAGLRQQIAGQQAAVAQAQQAAAAAAQVQQAAQSRFDQALEDFRQALAALRNAKDEYADLVIRHYRCSPCEAIANHWATAGRLRDLLDQLAAMLAQAQARVAAQLPRARQVAEEAETKAAQAEAERAALEARRDAIEQELRDAVDSDDDCLSLEPQEGWGWMNLASMDSTRGRILPEGAIMAWRSRFKGVDVRVWVRPGCLRSQIEGIKWRRVNELNTELRDLQEQLAQAEQATAEARRAAAVARAVVDGLEAEKNALDALERALRDSGIGENTDNVLNRLDELSADCAQALKDNVRGAREARRRQRAADGRAAAAEARRDAARRRAGAAAAEVDGMDPSAGDDEDRARHDGLDDRADGLADDSGDERPRPPPSGPTSPPDSLDQAERQRRRAEQDAADAEERAARAEAEADELEDAVDELEDEVDRLRERLEQWRRYHRALAAYQDCLRRKQAAAEELARLNEESASALQELANLLGEAADGLSEAAGQAGELGRISDAAAGASERAGELADKLQRIGNAMEVIDAVMRSDELTPAEKLEAMSKAFEEARRWLPELPGVSEMLQFYNEAMSAIAARLAEIENVLIQRWADLVEAGAADPEDAPVGLREEVRKAARIRELMRIISRNCGSPPVPPAAR